MAPQTEAPQCLMPHLKKRVAPEVEEAAEVATAVARTTSSESTTKMRRASQSLRTRRLTPIISTLGDTKTQQEAASVAREVAEADRRKAASVEIAVNVANVASVENAAVAVEEAEDLGLPKNIKMLAR